MMKHEFEELAGYEVSFDDYTKIIEPMYTATELSKAEFVKCIDKKRFALKTEKQYRREMKEIAEKVMDKCGHVGTYSEEEELETLCKEYANRFGYTEWYMLHGHEFHDYRGCRFVKAVVFCVKGREAKTIEFYDFDTIYG